MLLVGSQVGLGPPHPRVGKVGSPDHVRPMPVYCARTEKAKYVSGKHSGSRARSGFLCVQCGGRERTIPRVGKLTSL